MNYERLINKTQSRVAELSQSVVRQASVAPNLGRIPVEKITAVYGRVTQTLPFAAGDLPIQGMVFPDSQITLHGKKGDGFSPNDFTLDLLSAPPYTLQFPKPLRTVTKLTYKGGEFAMRTPSSIATPMKLIEPEGEQIVASHLDLTTIAPSGDISVRTGVPYTMRDNDLSLQDVLDISDPRLREKHTQNAVSTMLKASAVLFEMSIFPKTWYVQVGVE